MISVAQSSRFSWRHWDGELVLYDDLSGVTRLIEGPVGTILEILTEIAPTTRSGLGRHIEAVLDVPMDVDHQNMVNDALRTLIDYGLVVDEGDS